MKDAPGGSVRVLQGFLEHSNVEPVREMVDMISGVRAKGEPAKEKESSKESAKDDTSAS